MARLGPPAEPTDGGGRGPLFAAPARSVHARQVLEEGTLQAFVAGCKQEQEIIPTLLRRSYNGPSASISIPESAMPMTEILCAILDRRIAMARADSDIRGLSPNLIINGHRPVMVTHGGYKTIMDPFQEAMTRIVGVFDAKIAEEADERADLIRRVALLQARVDTLEREMRVAAPGVRAAIVAEDEKSWAIELAAEEAEASELGNAEEAMRIAIQRQREGREARAAARTAKGYTALVESSPGLAHPSTPRSPSGTSCASWAVP